MKNFLKVPIFVIVASLAPPAAYADTPFDLPSVNGLFTIQVGDDHYFVIEDLEYAESPYWAIWRLNRETLAWDPFLYGAPTPGEKWAEGNYLFDAAKGILIWEIRDSRFFGCSGPEAGVTVFDTVFDEPSLFLTVREARPLPGDDDEPLELTRISGTPGLVTGDWSLTIGPNDYLFEFDPDGTLKITGNVWECDIDD